MNAKGASSTRREGYSTKPNPGRDRAIVERLKAGETGSEIARSLGLSRERVRQIADRLGFKIRALRADHKEEARRNARKEKEELKHFQLAEKRMNMIIQLRRFYATYGRSPTGAELGTKAGVAPHPELPRAQDLGRLFGSMPAAFRAAGIPSRSRGSRGHLKERSR